MDASTSHLLAIILAPTVIGFSWLFLVSLLHPRDPREQKPTLCEMLPPPILTMADAFDPDRQILWLSQVPFLQMIGTHATFGACLRVCDNCMRRYPELYEGTSAESWLRFLERNHLIEVAGARIRLTADGRELLRFLLYQTNEAATCN
jgi:hypothetical protein